MYKTYNISTMYTLVCIVYIACTVHNVLFTEVNVKRRNRPTDQYTCHGASTVGIRASRCSWNCQQDWHTGHVDRCPRRQHIHPRLPATHILSLQPV